MNRFDKTKVMSEDELAQKYSRFKNSLDQEGWLGDDDNN